MSHDPSASSPPPSPHPTAAAATSPAPPSEMTAVARARADQVSFWSSFFLGQTRAGELPIYHHSNLFYWWPVWAFGFLFSAITFFDDRRMAIVPPGTIAAENRQVVLEEGKPTETRDVLILRDQGKLVTHRNADGAEEIYQPHLLVTSNKGVGSVFIIILLVVIVITNVTLRGLWSVVVLVILVMMAIIFAVAGWWDLILGRIGQLAIYINLGGYLTLSIFLFVLWCLNVFIFDRQTYMIFTPGQMRVRLEIGGGETVYDTAGMVFHKERADLFRHWVLGFGSGDLVVRPAGLGHALELPNVLRVGQKVKQIERMVKEKLVVSGPTTSAPRP